jgi:predicted nucleic acid-binding protein
VILVDSNIPMYLVGAHHPYKRDAQQRLEQLLSEGRRLVTDAEVFQEILHRYAAIRRLDAIPSAFQALLSVVEEVFPVTLEDVLRGREILLGARQISARDALHIAIMEAEEITEILSFDRGFDGYPGIERIGAL